MRGRVCVWCIAERSRLPSALTGAEIQSEDDILHLPSLPTFGGRLSQYESEVRHFERTICVNVILSNYGLPPSLSLSPPIPLSPSRSSFSLT